MRIFFFLLILVNAAFAAYIQLSAGSSGVPQLPTELNPEKIKLLPTPPAVVAGNPGAKQPSPAACLEWGSFVGVDLQRAEAAIAQLQLGASLSQRAVGEIIAYWVHIPPLKTRRDADKKIEELKKFGVTDYFLIQDGSKWNNAISMQIFRNEEAAKKYLAELKGKGVKSATIGERSLRQMMFVVREPAENIAGKMVELKQEFAGSELKATKCELPSS